MFSNPNSDAFVSQLEVISLFLEAKTHKNLCNDRSVSFKFNKILFYSMEDMFVIEISFTGTSVTGIIKIILCSL